MMAIFSLIPVNLDDPDWEASSHRGRVTVRAANEQQARAIAAEAFDVKTGFRPGQGMRFPPWTRAAMVRVERIDDPRFEPEGPAEVMEPTF
jgi:hypothetical protein